VTWAEVARLAEGPPADLFGVVVDGRLLPKLEGEEEQANERAAGQRRLGSEASVIRVPVPVVV
jgi:hypothetical protein